MCDKKHTNKHQVKEDQTHMPSPPEGTLSSSSQLMAQLFIILEWPLDPFLVREGDHKLNFIPFKHLFFTYDLHVPLVPF